MPVPPDTVRFLVTSPAALAVFTLALSCRTRSSAPRPRARARTRCRRRRRPQARLRRPWRWRRGRWRCGCVACGHGGHPRDRLRPLRATATASAGAWWPGPGAQLTFRCSCCEISRRTVALQQAGRRHGCCRSHTPVVVVFGRDRQAALEHRVVFAFQVLPAIIFVSAVFATSIPRRHAARGQGIRDPDEQVDGASGAESLNVAASIFMGQTEAPLTIRPFLPT